MQQFPIDGSRFGFFLDAIEQPIDACRDVDEVARASLHAEPVAVEIRLRKQCMNILSQLLDLTRHAAPCRAPHNQEHDADCDSYDKKLGS